MLPALYPLTSFCFFFFNDTATTEIYTLSLHDALPISAAAATAPVPFAAAGWRPWSWWPGTACPVRPGRSEEHTSELQSPCNLVCRLLLEKKKKRNTAVSLYLRITTLRLQLPCPRRTPD